MTYHVDTMKEATDLVMRLRVEEGDIVLSDVVDVDDPESPDDLADLWLLASEWKTAANLLEKTIGQALVKVLDGGGVTVGDLRVFTTKGYTKETCVDIHGFLGWLEANPGHAVRVINPNTVKKGSLPEAVRDTFFHKEKVVKPDSEPVPTAVPVDVLEQNKIKKELAG